MRADAQRAYAEAATKAVEAFPIEPASIELVSLSENVTFRVRDKRDGGSFVLRLHRPGYNSHAQLESERVWTQALADRGVAAPTGIKSTSGDFFVGVSTPSMGEQRLAGVTRWMHGQPLSDRLESSSTDTQLLEAYRDIGGIAARMHCVAEHWTVPEAFTRPRLDAAGLLGEAPRWGRFWEHPRLSPAARRHLLALRAELREDLRAYGQSAQSFGLIHADLHAENIIIGERQNAGVIDFDDMAWGWFSYDLATALLDHWGEPHYETLRGALLEGYGATRALGEDDIAILDRLVLLRAMSLIGWYGQRPEQLDGEYFEQLKQLILRFPLGTASHASFRRRMG